ncbi:hypothetical protein STAS_16970 [Striga asiatica]|uniref:Uncharacterized protein n=1 Tax=Striga asiatica TaxID=4170 RepID=A0A5A7Q503_STRAF|nr:hypothetical protein STAS_16970 [Striga asiatica]
MRSGIPVLATSSHPPHNTQSTSPHYGAARSSVSAPPSRTRGHPACSRAYVASRPPLVRPTKPRSAPTRTRPPPRNSDPKTRPLPVRARGTKIPSADSQTRAICCGILNRAAGGRGARRPFFSTTLCASSCCASPGSSRICSWSESSGFDCPCSQSPFGRTRILGKSRMVVS